MNASKPSCAIEFPPKLASDNHIGSCSLDVPSNPRQIWSRFAASALNCCPTFMGIGAFCIPSCCEYDLSNVGDMESWCEGTLVADWLPCRSPEDAWDAPLEIAKREAVGDRECGARRRLDFDFLSISCRVYAYRRAGTKGNM